MDLLEELQTRLGFTYDIYLGSDGHYGTLNPDTLEWDGLVREIMDGVC